jgi:hypothetical protein
LLQILVLWGQQHRGNRWWKLTPNLSLRAVLNSVDDMVLYLSLLY